MEVPGWSFGVRETICLVVQALKLAYMKEAFRLSGMV